MENVLFYSRVIYADLFPKLVSRSFNSFHVTTNKDEKRRVLELGGQVVGCFEEEFEILPVAAYASDFLQCSFGSDRSMGWISFADRRIILGKLISFFRRILSERNYTAVIHETISIEHEEVLSKISEEFKVLDLTFLPAFLNSYFYWKHDPYSSSFDQNILENTKIKEDVISLVHEYIEKVKNRGHKPFYGKYRPNKAVTPLRSILSYAKNWSRHFSLEKKFRDSVFYHNHLGFNEDVLETKINEVCKNRNDYNNIEELRSVKFYFYPLHYEPEATLLYFNPIYSNQTYVIEQIAHQLPLDTILVIKEHPQQPGTLMLPRFYQLRKQFSNVLFLPADKDSYQIIKLCKGVITINGSVGWEALVNNVPTIAFGNVFYDKHPDLIKVRDVKNLSQILEEEHPVPSDKNTINYASKILSLSHKGVLQDTTHYSSVENISNVVSAIELTLKNKRNGEVLIKKK